MEKLPIVVICGRPNVGKSTLFNTLVGKRIAIVDPMAGVTRDRNAMTVFLEDRGFELFDTGGIGLVDDLSELITRQACRAIADASLILFLVDIQSGITPLDMAVANLLKKEYPEKCVLLLANKADHSRLAMEKDQFYRLGFGEPLCISAAHYQGIGDLKEKIYERLKPLEDILPAPAEPPLKIAVVGKTNAGKSTFINALAQAERVIVSETPGTTRDSIDVYFEKDGKGVVAIDTAGLKRRRSVKGNVDFYSQTRAFKAVRRAEVVVFMFDASSDISKTDKEIAAFIRSEYKPAIIAVNKWDLARGTATPKQYEQYLSQHIPGLAYAPIIFLTATAGKNVAATIDLARNMYKQALQRIGTGELNRVLQEKILPKKSPAHIHGRQGKIYYATQVGSNPPTFVLFVNDPQLFPPKYHRYLFNQFQWEFGFREVPVKFEFKKHRQEEEGIQ